MNRSVSRNYPSNANPVPVMLVLLVVTLFFGGLVIQDDNPAGFRTVSNTRIACPTPRALESAIQTAVATESYLRTFLNAAAGKCALLRSGDQVRVLEHGGLFWWRVKVEKDGRQYWTPYDVF